MPGIIKDSENMNHNSQFYWGDNLYSWGKSSNNTQKVYSCEMVIPALRCRHFLHHWEGGLPRGGVPWPGPMGMCFGGFGFTNKLNPCTLSTSSVVGPGLGCGDTDELCPTPSSKEPRVRAAWQHPRCSTQCEPSDLACPEYLGSAWCWKIPPDLWACVRSYKGTD